MVEVYRYFSANGQMGTEVISLGIRRIQVTVANQAPL